PDVGGTVTDRLIPFPGESAGSIFQPLTLEFWIVWRQKNKGDKLFVVPALRREKPFSRPGFHLIYFEILQEISARYAFYISLVDRLFPIRWLPKYSLLRWVPSQ